MITPKDLKAYQFDCIGNYFDYIVESRINGNSTQVVDLIKAMSIKQKKDFIKYCAFTAQCVGVETQKSDFEYLHNKAIDLL